MSRPTPTQFRDALAPVRQGVLAGARADADATAAAAERESQALLARAREEAAGVLADARARGARDAATLEARERARGRREARATVLRAQREAYDDLRRAARAAARQLRDGPDYPSLLAALTARVRDELGPAAVVREHPDGGVVAAANGRRVDAGLGALADRALADLAPDLQGLWAP